MAALLVVAIGLLLYLGSGVEAATITPIQNASQDQANSLMPHTAQDPNGNLHVVWDTTEGGRKIRWRKGTWNAGANRYDFGQSVIIADAESFQYTTPSIAVAPNGTVLVAWSKNFQLYVRSWNMNDAQPGGTPVLVMPGFDSNIAVDSNNHFHIVANGDFFVQYCEWDGTRCVKRDAFSQNINANPDVAVDSTNGVHVVWGGSGIRYRTRAAGQEWGNIEQIATGGNVPSVAADGVGRVHIVWSQDYNIQYCRKTAAGCTDQRALDAGQDLSPSVGATPEGSVVVMFYEATNKRMWMAARENGTWSGPQNIGEGPTRPDLTTRSYTNRISAVWSYNYDISAATVLTAGTPPPTPTPTPPPISGSLTINGGAPFTNQASVNVGISRTSAAPATSYSIADDADPGTPATAFSDPAMTVPLTLNVADGQCRAHVVSARISNSQGVSPAFSNTIIYDPSARGIVRAQNPNSALNQPLNAIGTALVPTGDLAYTRQERVTIMVMQPAEECSGLKRYAIVSHGAPAPATDSTAWKDLPAEGYVSALVQFTASAGQGSYEFDVYLQDQVDNVTATPYVASIIYDTEAPAVSGELTALATTSSAKGGIATITIGPRTVTDNFYPGGGSGQQYWGSWVVVKQTSAGAPSEDEWSLAGQIVPGLLDNTLVWNMARGMVDPFQPGTYTVYVRLLDGAGNASATLESQPVQVNQLEYQGYLALSER